MTLRLVYRLYGGENLKRRPSFYSKKTSMASFLHAAEAASADVVTFVDGPVAVSKTIYGEWRPAMVE